MACAACASGKIPGPSLPAFPIAPFRLATDRAGATWGNRNELPGLLHAENQLGVAWPRGPAGRFILAPTLPYRDATLASLPAPLAGLAPLALLLLAGLLYLLWVVVYQGYVLPNGRFTPT
ncbi:MAG: hypothetical protein WKG07_28550 [Hymenobacter sp.]